MYLLVRQNQILWVGEKIHTVWHLYLPDLSHSKIVIFTFLPWILTNQDICFDHVDGIAPNIGICSDLFDLFREICDNQENKSFVSPFSFSIEDWKLFRYFFSRTLELFIVFEMRCSKLIYQDGGPQLPM